MFKFESPTSLSFKTGGYRLIIKKAKGNYIWDKKGNKYYDFTSFFGVSLFGHYNGFIIKNLKRRLNEFPHTMADLFPFEGREKLSEKIVKLFKRKDLLVTFGISGTDAVELAIKTAFLYKRKEKIVSFKNSYHGLSLGVLPFTNLSHFQNPFRNLYKDNSIVLEYPEREEDLEIVEKRLKRMDLKNVAGVILEPVQGRGGIKIPPKGFLKLIYNFCKEKDIVFIVDEIFTGFSKTGEDFAFQYEIDFPDIVCLGKALGGGFPISACVGRREIMNVWKTKGDPLYATTFLAHPVSVISSLLFLELYEKENPKMIVKRKEKIFEKNLLSLESEKKIKEIRGKGIMWGIEFKNFKDANKIWKKLLESGFLTLLEGENHNVLSFVPSVYFSERKLKEVIKIIQQSM